MPLSFFDKKLGAFKCKEWRSREFSEALSCVYNQASAAADPTAIIRRIIIHAAVVINITIPSALRAPPLAKWRSSAQAEHYSQNILADSNKI